jgi:hypothetical protein
MNNLFVPYDMAKQLNELGFDKPCLFNYNSSKQLINKIVITKNGNTISSTCYENSIKAPIYQEALNWFQEKHKFFFNIFFDIISKKYHNHVYLKLNQKFNTLINPATSSKYYHLFENLDNESDTYHEAQQKCLQYMITLLQNLKITNDKI